MELKYEHVHRPPPDVNVETFPPKNIERYVGKQRTWGSAELDDIKFTWHYRREVALLLSSLDTSSFHHFFNHKSISKEHWFTLELSIKPSTWNHGFRCKPRGYENWHKFTQVSSQMYDMSALRCILILNILIIIVTYDFIFYFQLYSM